MQYNAIKYNTILYIIDSDLTYLMISTLRICTVSPASISRTTWALKNTFLPSISVTLTLLFFNFFTFLKILHVSDSMKYFYFSNLFHLA